MIDLAEHIKEYFLDDEMLTSLHMFRNGDKWHCNVTHRGTGAWGSTDSKDPVKAIVKAMEICDTGRLGVERSKAPNKKATADDLL